MHPNHVLNTMDSCQSTMATTRYKVLKRKRNLELLKNPLTLSLPWESLSLQHKDREWLTWASWEQSPMAPWERPAMKERVGGGTASTTPNRGQTTWLGSWSRAWIEEESPGKFCISVQGDPLPGPPDNRLKDDFLNSLKTIGLDFL